MPYFLPRVPSAKTTIEFPFLRLRAAASYALNAARLLSRLIGTMPIARIAFPKTGIENSSSFVTNLARGMNDESTGTS